MFKIVIPKIRKKQEELEAWNMANNFQAMTVFFKYWKDIIAWRDESDSLSFLGRRSVGSNVRINW